MSWVAVVLPGLTTLMLPPEVTNIRPSGAKATSLGLDKPDASVTSSKPEGRVSAEAGAAAMPSATTAPSSASVR